MILLIMITIISTNFSKVFVKVVLLKIFVPKFSDALSIHHTFQKQKGPKQNFFSFSKRVLNAIHNNFKSSNEINIKIQKRKNSFQNCCFTYSIAMCNMFYIYYNSDVDHFSAQPTRSILLLTYMFRDNL